MPVFCVTTTDDRKTPLSPKDAGGRRATEYLECLVADAPKALLAAYHVCGSRAQAEEIVQDAFARMLEHPLEVAAYRPLYVYFLKVIRGQALKARQTECNRKRRESQRMSATSEYPNDPVVQAERTEMAGAIERALDDLDPGCREAVGMCCELGLSSQEAAEVLGIPRRTVSERVQRGLERLRQTLTAGGFACAGSAALAEALQRQASETAAPQLVAKLAVLAGAFSAAPVASARVAPRILARGSTKVILGITAAACVLAGVAIWMRQERSASTDPPVQGARTVVYEDEFNGRVLDPFWRRTVGEGSAVLEGGRLLVEAQAVRSFRLESGRLELQGKPLSFQVGGLVSGRSFKAANMVVELTSTTGRPLVRSVYRHAGGQKLKDLYFGTKPEPVTMPTLRIGTKVVVDPSGWIAVFDSVDGDDYVNIVCRNAGSEIRALKIAICLEADSAAARASLSGAQVVSNEIWPGDLPKAEYTRIGIGSGSERAEE